MVDASCTAHSCREPKWMSVVFLFAGFYHLLFALWVNCWPHLAFDWLGLVRPNHPVLWRVIGVLAGVLGLALLLTAKEPLKHWIVALLMFFKALVCVVVFSVTIVQQNLPVAGWLLLFIDDVVWIVPFALILWAALKSLAGIPPSRREPYSVEEAAAIYELSDGRSLAEASREQTLALVFLRHFGCTFTRQILRGLEDLQKEAERLGARLVLVHMLQSGHETSYLGRDNPVLRIADPRCELYRAFGLGKGGFFELFGPRVWWRGMVAVLKGCGVGGLAGDGLQMPGAFVVKNSQIVAAQPARSAADLPDLPRLFENTSEAAPATSLKKAYSSVSKRTAES